MRREVGLAALAVVAGAWLGLSRDAWATLVGAIALVLVAEALNTAIEETVDLARPELDPGARRAKDVAAAGVLLASVAAAVVGALVLGMRAFERFGG